MQRSLDQIVMNRYTLIAIVLCLPGALSISACSDSDTRAIPETHNIEQVARMVARREDRVSASDLAHWIIEDRRDFMLIDVRSADEYEKGHIDGARNLSTSELLSVEQLEKLPDDRKLIVYSQGSETAAQTVVLLRLQGYNANLLLGGYNFWSRQVLNPDIHPTLADGEYSRTPEQQAIACYFVGGDKMTQASTPVRKPAFVPPVVSRPATPPPPATDEGC